MTARFRAVIAVHRLLLWDRAVLLLRRANTGYKDGNDGMVAGQVAGSLLREPAPQAE